jgi:L1 cell adhesion molecule like protein
MPKRSKKSKKTTKEEPVVEAKAVATELPPPLEDEATVPASSPETTPAPSPPLTPAPAPPVPEKHSKAPKKKAEEAKKSGNNAFSGGNYTLAVKFFSEAISIAPSNEAYYSNRSASYMKLGQYEDAIADGRTCVELAPQWGKGYSRLASALLLSGDAAQSVSVYCQGIAHDPTNTALTKGLATAQAQLAKKTEKKQEKKTLVDPIIGIDLGTTYSCVGVWMDDGVKIIPNSDGEKTTPSCVAFKDNGSRVFGQRAKNQMAKNPRNTIFDIKRILGQRWNDAGVSSDISKFPFSVVEGDDDKPMVQLDTTNMKKNAKSEYAPEEISAMVLQGLKKTAEDYLKTPVNRAVITVPAYFNDAQRQATKAAGAIAGLEVLRIINEPTAAALSYGLDNTSTKKTQNVCIFDLGGGTFDVSVLSIEGGIFTVKATGGDTRLGGEDFDNAFVEFLLQEAARMKLPSAREIPREMRRLKAAAEKAKRELSNSTSTEINIEAYVKNKPFRTKVHRSQFEKVNQHHFQVCLDTVKKVMKDSKLKNDQIDEVVLVGGSTRIPKLQDMLQSYFGGKELCRALNPDEAVAYGAAVQAAILSGERNAKTDDLLLMDVTPLSLGIETTGRVMSVIIPRNTPIPCVRTQTYTTEHNYQTQVDVAVYEGERPTSDGNNLLGEFTISGIERAKRGEPQIEVSFSLDSNGILDVKAIDTKTNAKAEIQIANRSSTSDADIKRMVADAERYRKADEARIKKIEAINELEAVVLEAIELADEMESSNPKLSGIIRAAAEKENQFLEEVEDDITAADINLRKRALERRMAGKGRS